MHIQTARTPLYPPVQAVLPLSPPPLFFPLYRTEQPVKAGTCARDRRALQQLALNVHVKHSELTFRVSCYSTFVVGAISEMCQPFRPGPEQDRCALGIEQVISLRHSAEGALPPSM